MTITRFVAKSAFRNKRRSLLTVAAIAFSQLLLGIMLCVWRSFYIDKGAPDSALRIMTRHKVSLANFLPIYYRDKIRTVPGVVHVVPMTWFGGKYKDDKPENYFAEFATDPDEYFDWFKDSAGFYFTRVDTAENMPRAAHAIDDIFHGTPVPTKSESEQAFKLDFINTLGSVKAFILGICGAVVFTTLLVCANTMAMSIRERTREVAVLRTLGFTRGSILKLLLGESIAISVIGGLVGVTFATGAVFFLARPGIGLPVSLHMTAL